MTGRTLHPSTLRAVTKIATEHGLPLVKAEWNHIIVGEIHLCRDLPGWASGIWHEGSKRFRCYDVRPGGDRFHSVSTLNGFASTCARKYGTASDALRWALRTLP